MNKTLFLILLLTCIGSCKRKEQKFSLEKIIFHSSMCFGTCPSYHLEIRRNRDTRLYSEVVFKKNSDYEEDKEKIGYFIGSIDKTNFIKLENLIQKVGIDTLKFDNINCCDGSVIKLIVYYNGKKKVLESMFPPKESNELIKQLFFICKNHQLRKTERIFKIENK